MLKILFGMIMAVKDYLLEIYYVELEQMNNFYRQYDEQ